MKFLSTTWDGRLRTADGLSRGLILVLIPQLYSHPFLRGSEEVKLFIAADGSLIGRRPNGEEAVIGRLHQPVVEWGERAERKLWLKRELQEYLERELAYVRLHRLQKEDEDA